jgi:hypothetical protein
MAYFEDIESQTPASGRTGAGTVPLDVALREAVRALGIEVQLLEQRALMLLPEVINEFSGVPDAMARTAEIRRGELVIWIRQHAVRHRLLFERHRIQARLNEAVGRDVVTSIRFGR